MPIEQRGTGQSPQMFSGLELRGIRWEEEQMQMVGDPQSLGAMPAGTIQHKHDLPGEARANRGRKGGEFDLKKRNADRRGQVEDRPTRRWMHKADEVAPLVTVLDGRKRALPGEAPDFVEDRLQPNAVFVHRPQLDKAVRKSRGDLA